MTRKMASPLILDLVIITELMRRFRGTPVVNALNRQKQDIEICCAPLLVFLRRTGSCLSAGFDKNLDL